MSKKARHKKQEELEVLINKTETPDIKIKNSLTYKAAFWLTLGLLSVGGFWIMKDFLLAKKVYLFKDIGSDSLNQIYPFIKMTIANIKSHGFPKWSFQQGLGQYIASFNVGNPFHWLTYFLGDSALPYSLAWIEFLKFILAGLLFYAYLKTAKMSPLACILGGFVFGLSSFITLGSSWFNFLSGWAVAFAFWLFALEIFLRKGRWQYLPLAVAFVAMDQPFNVFLFTEFSIVYLLCWYFFVGQHSLKAYTINILKIVGLGSIGLMLGSFMIGANLFTIFNSPRLVGESAFMAELKAKPLLQLVDGLQLGTAVTRFFSNNYLGVATGYKGWYNYFEAPNFYLGIFGLILFPQAYLFLKRKHLKPAIFLTIAILLFIIFPIFRFAFWGFTGDYYRISSLFIGVAVLLAALYVITKLQEGFELNLIGLGISVLFCIVLLNIDYAENWSLAVVSSEKLKSLFLVVLFGVIMLIYKFTKSNVLLYVMLAVTFIEVVLNAQTSVNQRDVISKLEWNQKEGYNDYSVEAIAFLKNKDKSFYRVEKDYSSGSSIYPSNNDGMVQGYNGTTVYTAFNHYSQVEYMAALDMIDTKKEDQTRWINGLRFRPFLLGQLSVKYVLSKGKIDFKMFGYDSLSTVGDVTIFQNPFALPMAYCYDSYMIKSDFMKLEGINKDISLLKAFVIEDKQEGDFKEFSRIKVQNEAINPETATKYSDLRRKEVLNFSKFEDNNIEGSISLDKPRLLILSIPFDKGWHAIVNGKGQEVLRINNGLSGLKLNSGSNTVSIAYHHPYVGLTKYTSFAGIGAYILLLFLSFKKKDIVEVSE